MKTFTIHTNYCSAYVRTVKAKDTLYFFILNIPWTYYDWIAKLCRWYTFVVHIPQLRNFLTMLKKDMKTCTIHKNYCSAYVRSVTARFSVIVHSALTRASSFIAVYILYSITGFRSTILYGFTYPWFKHPQCLNLQSSSKAVRKGV